MKTLPLALMVTLSLMTANLFTASLFAETIVDGVIYPEITDLGKPRAIAAQPQLGSFARPQTNLRAYDQQPIHQVAQLPPPPSFNGSRSTTIAPADVAPALSYTTNPGYATNAGYTTNAAPTVQSVPAYNQAAYGYGYTSVGAPQRVVYVQPASYTNTFPTQQVIATQPYVNAQPLGGMQPAGSAYNPFAPAAPSVPWRPIVNIKQMPNNYVVGQGIIGQPKVYVPSQPVRNFIRYITP